MTSCVPVRLAIAGPCREAVAEAVVNTATTSTLAIAKSRLTTKPPPQPQASGRDVLDVTPNRGLTSSPISLSSDGGYSRAGLRPGLLSKQVPRDDLPLYLRGSFVDARRAYFAVEMLQEMPLFERHRAVHLDRHVDHLLRRRRVQELGHRRLPPSVLVPAVVGLGRLVDERAGRLQRGCHLGD